MTAVASRLVTRINGQLERQTEDLCPSSVRCDNYSVASESPPLMAFSLADRACGGFSHCAESGVTDGEPPGEFAERPVISLESAEFQRTTETGNRTT